MSRSFKTVDLFAGPGGLAEGFSSLKSGGRAVFDIALSVEKERSAFATLRLRAFTRQFETLPASYYRYISGESTRDQMIADHPSEWKAAVAETAMLELGTDPAKIELDPQLDRIRTATDGKAILIGGPPCQAYSLVGRARNRGIRDYDPAADHRHFLYREYIRIIARLEPIAFVMENVKGILSSRVGGERIFDKVLQDLRAAGGDPDSYTILPLVADGKGAHGENIVRCEEFGVPQRRHRVILLGVRRDALKSVSKDSLPTLVSAPTQASVADVLKGMPLLRSGLSRQEDSSERWLSAAISAFRNAAAACNAAGLNAVAAALSARAQELANSGIAPPRSDRRVTPVRNSLLGAWLTDEKLTSLSNHESRGHMEGDLARYAFAAVFAEIFERSPKADEFPAGLAPDHRNWDSGKFADRFRVQLWDSPATTITSHISKDGHYFIHPDPAQCRSLTVREAARIQTFPDNYHFEGNRTEQYVQVGNAVPPLLARQVAELLADILARS